MPEMPMRTRRPAALLLVSAIALSFEIQLAIAATCDLKTSKDIVIALDVGHIAKQPGEECHRLMRKPCPSGQISARGVPEYDFNLELTKRIHQDLVRAGFVSTHVLTTQVRGAAGLKQRADRANKMNADIFLSIHHDGVRDEYLKPWLYDGKEHFFFDDSQGFSLHVSPRNQRYEESLELARILANQLIGSGLKFTRIHAPSSPIGARVPFVDPMRGIYERGDLAVLGKTEMPAVLLEAGVIVNRDEELLVSTPTYKGTVASAVIEAVTKFCNPAEQK
jgi:N-acetylmuramoyl-L-alanine amidase